MNNEELIIAIRLWLWQHEQECKACGSEFDGCELGQQAEHFGLELGAKEVLPLGPEGSR